MKVHREGTGFLLTLFTLFFVVNVTLYHTVGKNHLFYGVLLLTSVFFLLVLNFFRSPARRFPYDSEGLVIAPADGTIVAIEEVMEHEILHRPCLQISIFMSITNVHMNWFPVGGTVKYFKYHPGRFLVAWHPKSSTENERTTTVIETEHGHEVLFRQIAGVVARRIVSYVKVGNSVKQNDVCGFIKFGSRLDIMIPKNSELLVEIGDPVVGTQTPLARLK